MVSKKVNLVHDLLIDPGHCQVPLRVSLHRFKRFSRQIDRDLVKLVARWAHTAAPGATGCRAGRGHGVL